MIPLMFISGLKMGAKYQYREGRKVHRGVATLRL